MGKVTNNQHSTKEVLKSEKCLSQRCAFFCQSDSVSESVSQ